MNSLLTHLHHELTRCSPQPKRLLIAVSGGADSVALLCGLHALQSELPLKLEAAHFNHQTRGTFSDADQQWVENLCQSLEIPCHIGYRSSHDSSAEDEQSPVLPENLSENQLREMRFAFLIHTAESRELEQICLGHHQQDQVETMLHHLLRGTSLRGLTGIPQSRPLTASLQLFRPLLNISRKSILDYLAEIQQEYRSDQSNADLTYTRNRIRHELLPTLEAIAPQAQQQLLRLQEQMLQTHEFHQQLVAQLLQSSLVQRNATTVRLQRSPLNQAHPVLIRELFVTLWQEQNWPRQPMGRREWERLREFLFSSPLRMELPGKVSAEKRGELLILEFRNSQ